MKTSHAILTPSFRYYSLTKRCYIGHCISSLYNYIHTYIHNYKTIIASNSSYNCNEEQKIKIKIINSASYRISHNVTSRTLKEHSRLTGFVAEVLATGCTIKAQNTSVNSLKKH